MKRMLLLFSVPFFAYEIAVASMFHNSAATIKEWVTYHHMIGVEHFWLYNDKSSDNWKQQLRPFIKQGIVEVFDWPAKKSDWVDDQIAAFKDALYRGKQTNTKWLALIDQDEFILPMKESSLKKCLKKHFSSADAIYVNWLCFGTNHTTIPKGKPILNKLTACTRQNRPINTTCKSILRPVAARPEMMWNVHFCPLNDNAVYVNGSNEKTIQTTSDLKSNGKYHTKYLRINHYAHGDEDYFLNVRCKRRNHFSGKIGEDQDAVNKRHYREFNESKNIDIINFIKRYYPKQYTSFWLK